MVNYFVKILNLWFLRFMYLKMIKFQLYGILFEKFHSDGFVFAHMLFI